MARRVSPGDGVPLVGPQEELRGPNGYTPREFTSLPGRDGSAGFTTKKKQKKGLLHRDTVTYPRTRETHRHVLSTPPSRGISRSRVDQKRRAIDHKKLNTQHGKDFL